ncbi:hypothetical protein QBC41DRAFT_300296, partial [Cercophora samala]
SLTLLHTQIHGPVVTAIAVEAAKHVQHHIIPSIVSAVVQLGPLTEALRKDLEGKYPDILNAIHNGLFIALENGEKARLWAAENPDKTAMIIGGVILVVAPGLVTRPLLSLVGFAEGGVAAGSTAALAHSSIGNVAAGSIFATLQGAGAGGAGLAVVNGVVQGAGVMAVSGAVLSSVLEAKEGRKSQDKE